MYFYHPIDAELSLRLPEIRHAPEMHELVRCNQPYFYEWLPWAVAEYSLSDAEEHIRSTLRDFAAGRGFALHILEHGRMVGHISLHDLDLRQRSGDIGYWLGEKFCGRGIVSRSCRCVLSYAFADMGLERVTIRCAEGNTRSCAIPERLGMRYEGASRHAYHHQGRFLDIHVYSLLAAEFPSLVAKWQESPRGIEANT